MAAGKGKAAPRKKSAALRYRRIVPPSLARVRAYHPKPAGRCVLRRRLFPPRATLGQKFAKAGHLRKPAFATNAWNFSGFSSRPFGCFLIKDSDRGLPRVRIAQWIRNCFILEGARADDELHPRSFFKQRLRNALNFSGSVLIEAGNVIETHKYAGDFKEAS